MLALTIVLNRFGPSAVRGANVPTTLLHRASRLIYCWQRQRNSTRARHLSSCDLMAEGKSAPRSSSTERSYLAAATDLFTPWGSRTATPVLKPAPSPLMTDSSGLQNQHAGDPRMRRKYISAKSYPADCPPLKVHWFYAVDVSCSRPSPTGVFLK